MRGAGGIRTLVQTRNETAFYMFSSALGFGNGLCRRTGGPLLVSEIRRMRRKPLTSAGLHT